MRAISLEQALYRRVDGAASKLIGRSPGFLDPWLPLAEEMAVGFGDRPPGMVCPLAVFARPLGTSHVAVVQVADDTIGAAGPPLALLFRFLVLTLADYANYLGDPFAVADHFPRPWSDEQQLPLLYLPAEPLPPRTVEQVRQVLKRVKAHAFVENQDPETYDHWEGIDPEKAQSPALLGGVQVLVDGGRLVFERPGPDGHLMRGLWTLLPTRTRAQLWPASFAFGNALGFDAVVVPRAGGEPLDGYTTEKQAEEYPQGNYELNLQIAAESGDQAQLDALFSRRSWVETWRLGVILLLVAAGLVILMNLPPGKPAAPPLPPPADRVERAATAAGVVSSKEPWTAIGLLLAGHQRWGER